MTQLLAVAVPTHLVHLSAIDVVIVVFYFALVLSIGLYLKAGRTPAKTFSWPDAR